MESLFLNAKRGVESAVQFVGCLVKNARSLSSIQFPVPNKVRHGGDPLSQHQKSEGRKIRSSGSPLAVLGPMPVPATWDPASKKETALLFQEEKVPLYYIL